MKLLSKHEAKKYEETIFDFCTRSLVTCEEVQLVCERVDELYASFIEQGFESFLEFIRERREQNKSFDKFVIRMMEKFSFISRRKKGKGTSVDVPDSLIRAISLGYEMISENIYFENEVLQIAGEILELPEWELDDGEDLDLAVECLNTLMSTSETLSKEEKGVLKQALKRIHRQSCSCVVL